VNKKGLHLTQATEFLTVPEWTTLIMQIPVQIPLAPYLTPVMESLTAQDFKLFLAFEQGHARKAKEDNEFRRHQSPFSNCTEGETLSGRAI